MCDNCLKKANKTRKENKYAAKSTWSMCVSLSLCSHHFSPVLILFLILIPTFSKTQTILQINKSSLKKGTTTSFNIPLCSLHWRKPWVAVSLRKSYLIFKCFLFSVQLTTSKHELCIMYSTKQWFHWIILLLTRIIWAKRNFSQTTSQ